MGLLQRIAAMIRPAENAGTKAAEDSFDAYTQRQRELARQGWHYFEWQRPPSNSLIELMRAEWDRPIIRYREDLLPEMNMNGLLWRMWDGATIENSPVTAHFQVSTLSV